MTTIDEKIKEHTTLGRELGRTIGQRINLPGPRTKLIDNIITV
jgi:hypothetical protein